MCLLKVSLESRVIPRYLHEDCSGFKLEALLFKTVFYAVFLKFNHVDTFAKSSFNFSMVQVKPPVLSIFELSLFAFNHFDTFAKSSFIFSMLQVKIAHYDG